MKKVCGCVNKKPTSPFKSRGGLDSQDSSGDEFARWWEKRPESAIYQARHNLIFDLVNICRKKANLSQIFYVK